MSQSEERAATRKEWGISRRAHAVRCLPEAVDRRGIVGIVHPDPMLGLADELELEAEEKAEAGDSYGASLCRIHARRIRQRCEDLLNEPVPYGNAERLTGYPIRSILNMKDENRKRLCPNVGTANAGAFRLGDLPFKVGHGSPVKARLAKEELHQQTLASRQSARERRIRLQGRKAS